jgi:hypothetical protein
MTETGLSGGESFVSLRSLPRPKASQSSPVVLLNDTFDIPEDSDSKIYRDSERDYGLNSGPAGRQTGRAAPVWYLRGGQFAATCSYAQVHHPRLSKNLCLFADPLAQSSWLTIDRNFPPDIEVSVVVDPVFYRYADGVEPAVKGDTKSSNWFALSIRGNGVVPNDEFFPLSSRGGAALLIRSNGWWEYYENGVRMVVGKVSATDWYRITMRVVGDQLEVRISDQVLNLDPTHPGAPRTLHGEAAVPTHNFVAFGVCNSPDLPGPTGRELSVVKSLQITAADRISQSTH